MKYIIIHGDGMADWACEELDGKTPLAAAHKPNMDLMATRGTLGMVATIPKGMPSGSDVGPTTRCALLRGLAYGSRQNSPASDLQHWWCAER